MSNIAEYIDQYRSEGLSFFPIPARSKQANIEWKCYQERRPTDDEILKWRSNGASNIAIVCGKVSGNLVVIDFDAQDKFFTYCDLLHNRGIDISTYTRLVRTSKGMHVYFRLPNAIKSMKFPQVDIKAEGGYVIAPSSIHPSGAVYELVNPDIPIREIADLKDVGIDINQVPPSVSNETMPEGQTIPVGSQNDWLFKQASRYRRQGDTTEVILQKLLIDVKRCLPEPGREPWTELDLKRIAQSASKYTPDPNGNVINTFSYIPTSDDEIATESHKKVTEKVTDAPQPLSKRIEDWIKKTNGWFDYTEIDREFELNSAKAKHNRWMIIERLTENGTIESHKSHNKLYRLINTTVRLIDFKAAGNRTAIDIKYPFGIERFFHTYPGNVIILAGVTDTGKTAILLNLVRLNMYDFPIYYQSSEMGDAEIANRLQKFEGIGLEDWNFTPEERGENFADVVRPDAINLIDYLELTDNFYLANQHIKAIHGKLRTGIAIIAMQKAENAAYAYGGILTASLPRLYLTIDKTTDGQIIRMKKAKNWTDPEMNPNKLALNFKIFNGCKLIVTHDWHEDVK